MGDTDLAGSKAASQRGGRRSRLGCFWSCRRCGRSGRAGSLHLPRTLRLLPGQGRPGDGCLTVCIGPARLPRQTKVICDLVIAECELVLLSVHVGSGRYLAQLRARQNSDNAVSRFERNLRQQKKCARRRQLRRFRGCCRDRSNCRSIGRSRWRRHSGHRSRRLNYGLPRRFHGRGGLFVFGCRLLTASHRHDHCDAHSGKQVLGIHRIIFSFSRFQQGIDASASCPPPTTLDKYGSRPCQERTMIKLCRGHDGNSYAPTPRRC